MEKHGVGKIMVKPGEAAELIGISRSKIYELIAAGTLPAVRLEGGRLLRIPVAALQQIADNAMRDHANEPATPQ